MRHTTHRYRLGAAAALLLAGTPCAGAGLPAVQQNALVAKYCAVCHTDAANNGGLSLERFDAATAAPSLTGMLLSKISGGVPLKTVQATRTDARAAALVNGKIQSGAMNAAGIPKPDRATLDGFVQALAERSAGAAEWTVHRVESPTGKSLVASMLQEAPAGNGSADVEAYRLILACDAAAREGEMQLAWSPVPRDGTLAVSVDGDPAVPFVVRGSEKMGNGSKVVTSGLAALVLRTERGGRLPFPKESLAVSDLFPGQSVIFSFSDFPAGARQEFAACFAGKAGIKN